ncbi:N-acetylglucosamine kinase [Simiduia agarivorans]
MPIGEGQLYLGIDGGGSKTKAILLSQQGQVLGEGVAGPANPLHGVEQTFTSIKLAAELALEDAGLDVDQLPRLVAGAGLAGVNLPELYQVVEQWVHPFGQFHLTTDLHIACLGAHNGEDGAVIISGTGSCGYAHTGNKSLIVGAHGFPFGDKGSGAWLGLEALKHALMASDGLAPAGPLKHRIETALDAQGIDMVSRMAGATSRDYARLAPIVIELAQAGDPTSLALVQDGADYLAAVAEKLLALKPGRLSMIGGVAGPLQAWMPEAILASVQPAIAAPEMGAFLFARKQLALLEKTA